MSGSRKIYKDETKQKRKVQLHIFFEQKQIRFIFDYCGLLQSGQKSNPTHFF